jgi:hypothetical protein
MTLLQSQLYHDYAQSRRFETISWASGLLAAVVLGCLPFQTKLETKAVLATVAVGGAVIGRTAGIGASLSGGRADDTRDVSDQMYTQELAGTMYTPITTMTERVELAKLLQSGGGTSKKSTPPRKMFKIEWLVAEKEKYPHVMILGETGAGKTLLAEYITDKDKGTLKTFVSPCRDDNEFIDYPYVGGGFNYAAIGQYLASLVNEMRLRYQHSIQNVITDFGFRNVILDEGRDSAQSSQPFATNLLSLISLGRKRFIRMFLCTTSQSVKALGIEGEGDMRSNFTVVRLGKECLSYLRQLVAEGTYTQDDSDWFTGQADIVDNGNYRLALVNDMMCMLPDLSGYRKAKLEAGAVPPEQDDLEDIILSLPAPPATFEPLVIKKPRKTA